MKFSAKVKGLSRFFSTHTYTCCNCGVDLFDDKGICQVCSEKLPTNDGHTCKRCGASLGDVDNKFCSECERSDLSFDEAASVFVYDGLAASLLLGFKYGNKKYLSEFFARSLAKKFFTLGKRDFDLVIPVPMTKFAKKKRGYNQAELLTADFCDIIKLNCCADVLEKVRETPQQEKLDYASRRENLDGVFKVSSGDRVKGKRILLVDDVKTTGTTLNACAKALKQAGAVYVFGLTVAASRSTVKTERENHEQQKTT